MIQKFGDESSTFPDSFGAMSETERNWLHRRLTIENFFRRSTNLGLGAFSLAVLLLALSTFCLRSAWLIYDTYTRVEQANIEATLLSEQEPQDETHHFAVTATVLSQLNTRDVRPSTQCSAKSPACAAQRNMQTTLKNLWTFFERPQAVDASLKQEDLPQKPASIGVAEHVRETFLDEGLPDTITTALTKEFLEILDAREHEPQMPADLVPCPASTARISTRSAQFNQAGCMRALSPSLTEVLLPAQLRLSRPGPGPDTQSEVKYDARVLAEVSDSRVLDLALQIARLKWPAVFNPSAEAAAHGPQLVQAYFVSIDSVLRIWSRDQSNIAIQLPRQRLWGQRSYVQEFWRDNVNAYTTRPYLDLGRNGIVWSICDPLDLTYPSPSEPHFLGVVCYDFSLPHDALRKMQKHLDLLPMTSASLIEISMDEGGSLEASPVRIVYPSSELDQPGIAALRKDLDVHVKGARAEDLYTAVRPVSLSDEKKRAYLVPLGLANRKLSAFVIETEPHHVPLAFFLLACFGTSGLALTLGLWVMGFRTSKRLSDADSNIARLRGLPVGVLETDAGEVIVSANDRAEELIEAELPQSGERISKPVRYSDLFDLTMLYEDDSSDTRKGTRRKVRPIRYEDILERRRRGDSSTYYVPLRKKSTESKPTAWFRVTASPVLPHSPVSDGSPKVRVATFGVFAELLAGERMALEEAIRELSGYSSAGPEPST